MIVSGYIIMGINNTYIIDLRVYMVDERYINVAIAQIAPVWLNQAKTINKILAAISEAADKGNQLVTFGEALLPGYPFWLEPNGGAVFNSAKQKQI
jgi:nitrilase